MKCEQSQKQRETIMQHACLTGTVWTKNHTTGSTSYIAHYEDAVRFLHIHMKINLLVWI
jgi:hypothetical protein